MTGHQIDNFVGSLVEMAKAFEERPQLHHQIEQQAREQQRLEESNKALADSNDILRSHIDELNAKIMEVTKERDDVGFRHLEEVDKTNALLLAIRSATASLGQSVTIVDPPKAEPVSVQEDPTSTNISEPVSSVQGDTPSSATTDAGAEQASSQGQSDPLPTTTHHQEPSLTSDGGPTIGEAATDKPYAGKRYSDVARDLNSWEWPTYHRWMNGGGTHEDFYN